MKLDAMDAPIVALYEFQKSGSFYSDHRNQGSLEFTLFNSISVVGTK